MVVGCLESGLLAPPQAALRRFPLRVESNACKKPAPAGVCAAQRQLFGPLRGQKSEALFRLSKKSCGLF